MDTKDNISLIKPGILVSLKSCINGNVQYSRIDLSKENKENGANEVRWETTRVIIDPAEHEAAVKCRGRAVALIRSVCAATAFGLLCPETRLEELDQKTAEARAICNEHNNLAQYSRVSVYIMKARIASTDEEAIKSISEEVRSLLDSMNDGIAKCDAKVIRDACQKAQQISSMLAEAQAAQVSKAVLEAREAAREIVRRVEKRGEDAAKVLASITTRSIVNARMAFIDTDDEVEVPGAPMPQVNVQRFNIIEDDETSILNRIAALEATLEKTDDLV